ncbi:hypothetical protein D4759_31880, partial [Clostridiales bacterium AHG0011]|nr:hypothetical protein [Clostridiales bacterium AHG0011]
NPQRVFIPNSIKEYQEILETLVNDLEMRDNVVEKSGPDTIQKVFDELLTIYLKEKEKNG